jgi:uncharacterized protein (TIGR02569 family)
VRGAPPPVAVLEAFGVTTATPTPVAGGTGSSWFVGELVLKPADDPVSAEWTAGVLATIEEDGFRVARPVAAVGGAWLAGGWTASRRVPGDHEPRWADVIRAGEAFHHAVRDVPRPGFLEARADPWAVGDRVAWEELAPDVAAARAGSIARLVEVRAPLELPSQVIHGDLSENVLFADGLPPAVIDVSPYWRPPGFASAVVIADAVLWRGGGAEVVKAVAHVAAFPQLLIRAVIYRLVTNGIFHPDASEEPGVRRAVDLAYRLAAG